MYVIFGVTPKTNQKTSKTVDLLFSEALTPGRLLLEVPFGESDKSLKNVTGFIASAIIRGAPCKPHRQRGATGNHLNTYEELKMEPNRQKPYINVDFFEDLTGEIAETDQKGVDEIGTRVNKLRTEKGLSLEELSNLTGFEVGFLADIESHKVQPQLGTVIKLSKALDSAFGRLVSGVGNRLYSITRKADRKIVSRSTTQTGTQKAYIYKSLAPEVKGRHMEALIVQLEEDPGEGDSIHEGEEFVYVLEGIVALKIDDEQFDLEPGDSAYYLSTTPHLIAAKSGRATILAVLYGK